MDVSGLLTYRMMLTNLDSDVTSMQITNGKKSKRLLRVVHDVLSDGGVASGHGNDLNPLTQWSNGSLRMEATDVEQLYRSGLFVDVKTRQGSRLKCRVTQHVLSPAHGQVTAPILMTSPNSSSSVSGIAWTNIDSSCRLSYNVRLEGSKGPSGGGTFALSSSTYQASMLC